VAVVQFALREKTRLGALRIKDDVLVLQSLLWADEVREPAFPALETTVRISALEREMSAALVDSMAGDFEPGQFTDDYQVQLRKLIDAKIEQGESLDTEKTFGAEAAEAGQGEVIDLMEALKRSLEKKRSGRAAKAAGGSGAADSDDADTDDADTDEAPVKTTRAKASTARSKTTAAKPPARTTATKTAAAKAPATTASKAAAAEPAAKEPAKSRRKRA
jgi:DNA end-binding protein Ku